jgi:hypothetical protein
MKSPSSIRNGRFHPSMCRGKVQKMGVMCTHFPKMSGPNFLIILQKKKKKPKKLEKGEVAGSQHAFYQTMGCS